MNRYIDADKLVEYEEHAWDWDTVNGIETAIALRQVISDIRNEPTADVVEVVRGEWVIDDATTEHCSVCGHPFYTSALFAVGGNDEPPYCSNCGADMRERREDAEIH